MAVRIFLAVFVISIIALPALAEDKVYILKKPEPVEENVRSTYVNNDWGFGFDLREAFTFTTTELEDGAFTLSIELEGYPLTAALTTEVLDDGLSSLGYWRLMQQRDPSIADNLAYERQVEIAGIPAMQVRIEGSGQNAHFLILSIVFTSGEKGFILSCFAESLLYEKVPDFLAEIGDGFYFLEEDGNEETEPAGDDVTVEEEVDAEGR